MGVKSESRVKSDRSACSQARTGGVCKRWHAASEASYDVWLKVCLCVLIAVCCRCDDPALVNVCSILLRGAGQKMSFVL